MLAISPFPHLPTFRLFTARHLLIVLRLSALPPPVGPMPLLIFLQNGAVWQEMSDAFAVAAPHFSVGMSSCLHGDAATCDRVGVGRTREAVNEYGVYHVSNLHQRKAPLLVAGVSHPLVLCRESLQNNVLVTLVVHRLSHFLEKSTKSVQNKKTSGSWPGPMFMSARFLWHALLASLARLLYFSFKASQATCPPPAPSCSFLPSNFLTTLLAESDVVRSRTLQRFWFACFHVCSTTSLRRVGIGRVYDGWALTLRASKTTFFYSKRQTRNLVLNSPKAFLLLPAKTGQCFINDWVLLDATFSMATARR